MCLSAGRGNENEHLASRLNLYNFFFVFDLHSFRKTFQLEEGRGGGGGVVE